MLYSNVFIKQCMNLFDDKKSHLDSVQAETNDLLNEVDASYLSCDWEIKHLKDEDYKNVTLATKYCLMMFLPLIFSFLFSMNYFVIFIFTVFFAIQTLKYTSKLFRKSYAKIADDYLLVTKKILKEVDKNLEVSKEDLAEMDKLCKIFNFQVAEMNKLPNGVQNEN